MSAPHIRDASAPEQRPSASGSTPVYDADAEAAVLSAVMVEALDCKPGQPNRAFAVCRPVLGEGQAFYDVAHRRIWQAMVALEAAGDSLDAVMIGGWLKRANRLDEVGGVPRLGMLVDAVPSVANVETYARVVVDLWAVRDLGARCQRIAAESYRPGTDPVGWVAQSVVYLGESAKLRAGRETTNAGDIAREIYAELEETIVGPGAWLSTGLPRLDTLIGGLIPGDIVVIGAREGVGKSSLARRIALATAQAGRHAAIFTREMPKKTVAKTLLTTLAHINGRRWRNPGDIKKAEMTRAVQWLIDNPISIYGNLSTPAEVAAECKALKASKRGLDVVIADYLQAFTPSRGSAGGTREQDVSGMMAELARIALPEGADTPTIVISAVKKASNENDDPGPPTSNDLRDSNMISFWATCVLLLHRKNNYRHELEDKSGVTEVYMPKSRGGPTGYGELWFHAPTATFYDSEGTLYP